MSDRGGSNGEVPAIGGIYYVARPLESRPPYTYEIRFFDSQTRTSRPYRTITLDDLRPGLSVSPACEVLVSSLNVAALNVDLMLIENFR